MDQYILIITIIGLASFSMSWLPKISQYTGISYAIFYVLIGFVIYSLLPERLPNPMPQKNPDLTVHLTEIVVIISLMGAGIKIDRPFSFQNWSSPLKLATLTMMLCILCATLLGYYFLGLGLASATLLGAVLAPTDPVLAADVQVGPPNEKEKSETKFALTAEAGLNDGMAFPFTWLAITLGMIAVGKTDHIFHWFAFDVLYRIIAGLLIGYLAGKLIGYLVFNLTKKFKSLQTLDGLLAISTTLLVYGVTEILCGYGFISVFVCAATLRHYEKEHAYHTELHSFTDQVERLLVCVLLLLFGGSLASGILAPINWQMFLVAIVFLFVVRPLSGMITLSKSKMNKREKLAISFLGIKGMGSIFYLSFAFSKFNFEYQDELWAVVALTVLISIMLHGLTATPLMKKLKEK